MRQATRVPAQVAGAGRDRAYWLDLAFGRTVPALLYGVVVLDQLLLLGDDLRSRNPLSIGYRLLAIAYFTLLVVLFITRLRALKPERRPVRIAAAFIGSFAVMVNVFLPHTRHGGGLLLFANLLLAAGVAWSIVCLLYLRRSFAILPEARRLVSGGPYGVVRHPLYLGEGTASLGVLLPGFGVPQLILAAIIVVAQALRIRWEEEALAAAFGSEYRSYRRRVPLIIPVVRPRQDPR